MKIHTLIPDEDFVKGEFVFKLSTQTVNGDYNYLSIIATYQDYIKKLFKHHYTPLIYLLPIPLRIAYLYDCFDKKSDFKNFTFWVRKIGTEMWMKWFTVGCNIEDPNKSFQILLEGYSLNSTGISDKKIALNLNDLFC
jgi:hypothetical protein